MLEQKEKPCKGTGKAKGLGCGKLTKYRVYELGKMCGCYSNFLLNTEQGKILLQKARLIGTKKVNTIQKQKTKEQKISLLTPDKYRSSILQPNINKVARLIDYGCTCIATDNFGKMAGGHRISVGANRTTAFNLHNIHIQSFASNSFKGGDNLKYNIGIKERYGIDYLNFLDSLHLTPPIKLSVKEMQEINIKALKIIKELERDLIQKESKQRIELRNKYNLELGIYDKEFSVYG